MALISVVVPVYKADDCLDELYRRLSAALLTISDDYEIVFVEDCGGDGSWALIEHLAQKDKRVTGLQFSRNFGQHYGITAGLDHCDGDWVVVMDCDLQDQPEEIPRLYQKALEGYDVVLARRGKRRDPFFKRILSSIFYIVFRYLAEIDYDGQAGNFRIISRKVVKSFRNFKEQLRFFGGLITWMGYPTASIEVKHAERFRGETSYTFKKLLKLAFETIIAYSDKPLRLTIKFGFSIAAFSFTYGTYIIYRSLFYGTPILGWGSLIVSIYFIGGIIISSMGILGIYIGKIYDETKGRPLYILAKKTL